MFDNKILDGQLSLFDCGDSEQFDFIKPQKSTDWKWSFSDYPKEKNGLKVFSCFACGGAVQWATNYVAAKF